MDSVAAQPLAGTDGASYPFWSPDTASVGFFADDKLKRIDIVGGAPQVLANAVAPWGGSWNRDGTILFAPAGAGPLLKVPATGGEPVAVTQLEAGQAAHKFPQFLPDGRHFIYFIQGAGQGVYAGSLDGGPSKKLVNADAAAVVFPSGFLLMARQTTLFAQAFDFKRQELSGNPFPVAEHAALNTTGNAAGLSATLGIVAYRTSPLGLARQLTWLDRSGKTVGTIGGPDTAVIMQWTGLFAEREKSDAVFLSSHHYAMGPAGDPRMGAAARETVVARYSGQQWAPRFREVLLEARDTGPIR